MTDEVQYFGYGANRHPTMMKAIIGRVPEGYPATISGFELCIQNLGQMPPDVQKILSPPWDETFRSYILRPASSYHPKPIRGMVWKLTPEERKLIDFWEMTGIWYKKFVLAYQKPDENVQIEIQIVDDQPVAEVLHHRKYKSYLNNKRKMWNVAMKLRERYLHDHTN